MKPVSYHQVQLMRVRNMIILEAEIELLSRENSVRNLNGILIGAWDLYTDHLILSSKTHQGLVHPFSDHVHKQATTEVLDHQLLHHLPLCEPYALLHLLVQDHNMLHQG